MSEKSQILCFFVSHVDNLLIEGDKAIVFDLESTKEKSDIYSS